MWAVPTCLKSFHAIHPSICCPVSFALGSLAVVKLPEIAVSKVSASLKKKNTPKTLTPPFNFSATAAKTTSTITITSTLHEKAERPFTPQIAFPGTRSASVTMYVAKASAPPAPRPSAVVGRQDGRMSHTPHNPNVQTHERFLTCLML